MNSRRERNQTERSFAPESCREELCGEDDGAKKSGCYPKLSNHCEERFQPITLIYGDKYWLQPLRAIFIVKKKNASSQSE